LSTECGSVLHDDLSHKNKKLQEVAAENYKFIAQTSQVLTSLNKLKTELNIIQHERVMRGEELDGEGNILVPPQEKQIKLDITVRHFPTQSSSISFSFHFYIIIVFYVFCFCV
jgi:hypothetical protein